MAHDPQILLRAVAVIALIAAALATAVQFDRESAPERSGDARLTDDTHRAELERCRTITPEDLATDAACQAAWAESRRRFFTPSSDGREQE